jgi:hypothetical protein
MREIAPSLKALADSPARVNRDMARQLAIPLGLVQEVEDLCLNHECPVCGNDIELRGLLCSAKCAGHHDIAITYFPARGHKTWDK